MHPRSSQNVSLAHPNKETHFHTSDLVHKRNQVSACLPVDAEEGTFLYDRTLNAGHLDGPLNTAWTSDAGH